MMQFKAFKPEAMNKIAGAMGYQGDMSQFQQYVEGDPQRQAQMQRYTNAAMKMAQGGSVQKFAPGGTVTAPASAPSQFPPFTAGTVNVAGSTAATPTATTQAATPTSTTTTPTSVDIGQETTQRMFQPALPVGGVVQTATTPMTAAQDLSTATGQLTGGVAVGPAVAGTATTAQPQQMQANVMQADTSAQAVNTAVNAVQAAQANPQDPRAQVTAAQQTASSVGNLQAAQGNAILMNNPQQRQIQAGELISGTGVDATKAAQATAQTQAAAASAQPTQQALVQGQLANLMTQFGGTNPPAWAAGAMRTANAQMAARGLGASSLAGQAIVQAAMEASLPIAQADAGIIAQFERDNLSNRQQSAMLAAEQRAKFLGQEFDQTFQTKVQNAARVADVANMNFTAEQQVALENSRIANTMNLNNLSNSQAMVMAEASALSQLDSQNLNNRQQSAVQNANAFLQVDMANLSNQQQTELFKGQQRIQSLFTDQAAENAARQFNASSENQVDQFFANLSNQVSQFNASQQNSQAQFNAGQINTIERFNAELNNQRDQFNAQNQLVIAQSNAQWRREIATADTAAVNRSNELNAKAILDMSDQAYNNLWTYFGDNMEWAWTSAENELNRNADMAIATLNADERAKVAAENNKTAAGGALGGLIGTLGSAYIGSSAFKGFGCWIAREIYGKSDPRWFVFRMWLQYKAPAWFKALYFKHGESYAKFISNKPVLKWMTKQLMDIVVEEKEFKHASC